MNREFLLQRNKVLPAAYCALPAFSAGCFFVGLGVNVNFAVPGDEMSAPDSR